MTSRSAAARLLAAFAICAGGSGCSFAAADMSQVENTCEEDADCAAGATCDTASRMCVSEAPSPLVVGLEVTTHDRDGTTLVASFEPIDVRSPMMFDIALQRRVMVVGTVHRGADGSPVAAELEFTRASAFPGGEEISARATTLTDLRLPDGSAADYRIELYPGSYDVAVRPSAELSSELPPRYAHIDVPAIDGETARLDIDFPAEAPVISGDVVDTTETAQAGLSIVATDVATGRVISSTDVTDASGGYSIRLDPLATDYAIRIQRAVDEQNFPTYTIDQSYLYPDAVTGAVRILVPAAAGTIHYVGFIESAPGVPVADAVMQLRSSDVFDSATGVTGVFQRRITTDAEGQFDVDVLEGTYEIVITPPDDSELGVFAEQVRIEPPVSGMDLMGQLFMLPQRARYGGTVRTSDDRRMADATVDAYALRLAIDGELAALHNRSSNTVTDATGQFTIPLDVGSYDIVIRPPSESGFPWIVERDLPIGSDAMLGDLYQFPAPVPIRGTVRDSAHLPLAGAEIVAYAVVTDEHTGTRAVRIARAVADATGTYALLLPPEL